MTKKDYELFANEIHKWTETQETAREITLLVNVCKAVFKQDNPLFQADKFETACYEGKHIRKSISGKV